VWKFRNKIRFYGEKLIAPRPTPTLEDHTLSAVCDWLFSILTATLHIGGCSSIRNLRMRHAVVTGKRLSRIVISSEIMCHARKIFFQREFNYNDGNECENPSVVGVVLFKKDRKCTYKCSIEVRSRNHCCYAKAKKYYMFWVWVCSLSHPACNAHAPCYIVICGLPGSALFFHIIS